jgi:FMN phosphatase YigB (HAD superfamily)
LEIEAVIFDWGGTLTAWHDIDFHAESLALAEAVRRAPGTEPDRDEHAARLHQAGATIWGWSRDHQRSATLEDLFAEAGLDHDPDLLTAYYEFWEPHTLTDPQVGPMWTKLKERGIKVGVLSNTIWPRAWHEGFFRRDGVLDLVDGAVYTSEVPGPSLRPRRSPLRWPPWTSVIPVAASTSATASSTTSGARTTPVSARSTCRTASSRPSRSGTARASRTRSPTSWRRSRPLLP